MAENRSGQGDKYLRPEEVELYGRLRENPLTKQAAEVIANAARDERKRNADCPFADTIAQQVKKALELMEEGSTNEAKVIIDGTVQIVGEREKEVHWWNRFRR